MGTTSYESTPELELTKQLEAAKRAGRSERCACGFRLHYSNLLMQRLVEALIRRLGPNIRITTSAGTWWVPRHYIALHGIKAKELPALAQRYGWRRRSPTAQPFAPPAPGIAGSDGA